MPDRPEPADQPDDQPDDQPGQPTAPSGSGRLDSEEVLAQLESDLPEAAVPDLDNVFDGYGLFAGAVGEHVWPGVCAALEDELDAEGWDAPARVYAVVNPVETERATGLDTQQLLAAEYPDGDRRLPDGLEAGPGGSFELPDFGFSVVHLGEITGSPEVALWGFTAPRWAAALVCTYEAWAVDPLRDEHGTLIGDEHAHLPASQHPRRREQRHVLMTTRAGARYVIVRDRDGEAGAGGEPPPRLADVLLRCLGVPTRPPATGPGDMLGRLALLNVNGVATTLLSDDGPEGEDGPDIERQRARAELALLDPEQRRLAIDGLLEVTTISTAAHLADRFLGPGAFEAPHDVRAAVHTVASTGPRGEPDAVDAVISAATALAGASFSDLVAVPGAASLFPTEVASADPGWADEGILARRLVVDTLPTQEAILSHIARLSGQPTTAIERALDACGWLALGDTL